ncbi:MAG: low molecular weight phosphotyrosine protein phosphatase [Gammaproteobacteria bacterium]|nr:low molecular weight phosphotyrosine protein phosphatase [Gammaproteobacteria bacterium]MDH5593027.1 low molecular weight phosphotyrosine protein phosphatase [Gammaproteobacteria bacterium]MDH5614078.1 low molecular weight phosphotyrosine protein phosphatase [Gammaproteobacteria bacterium]
MVKVLFVCMGNICRSPTAEGVFAHLVNQSGLAEHIHIDSAGTHAYHVGHPPDSRAQKTAKGRGIDISHLRARRVSDGDFYEFDYVLAMDRDNYHILKGVCPPGEEHRLKLFLEYAPDIPEDEVPDPYYGGPSGFERVMDMIAIASEGLLAEIRTRL